MRALVFLAVLVTALTALFTQEVTATPFGYDLPPIPPLNPPSQPGQPGNRPTDPTADPELASQCPKGPRSLSLVCREGAFHGRLAPMVVDLKNHPDGLFGDWRLMSAVSSDGRVNPKPMPIGTLSWQANKVTSIVVSDDRHFESQPVPTDKAQPGVASPMFDFYDDLTAQVYLAGKGPTQGLQCRQVRWPETPQMICKWYQESTVSQYVHKGYLTYERNKN